MTENEKTVQGLFRDNLSESFSSEDESRESSLTSNTAVSEDSNFHVLHQGPLTNQVTKLRQKDAEVDLVAEKMTSRRGDIWIEYPMADKIKTSAFQLFDALTMIFTETGAKGEENLRLSLTNYMELRKLSDRKETRKQVKEDIHFLKSASLNWIGEDGKLNFVNFFDHGNFDPNTGDIEFSFTKRFGNILLNYPTMSYSVLTLQTDNKRNPNSYYFLRKIQEHKRMNIGTQRADIISVKTLIDSALNISLEEASAKGRHITRDTIDRFERDMDALCEVLTWEYCHSKGKPVTDEELQDMDYKTFENLLVKVTWRNYPDQSQLIAGRARRAEEAKKAKARQAKKTAKAKSKKTASKEKT